MAMEIEASIPPIDLYLEYKMDMEALRLSHLSEEHPIMSRIPLNHCPKLPTIQLPTTPTHLTYPRKCRCTKKTPPTCISCISQCTQQITERINPLAMALWHDQDTDKLERVQTFLPTNIQGESVKEQWTDDHIEFITENEDNPNFLVIYSDGSLTNKDGRRQTGYRVAGYYLGKRVFERKGALGEQAKVYNTEMTGLSEAREAAKSFIINGEWTQQPTQIVFYADNTAAISHIYKGTPGKAQVSQLTMGCVTHHTCHGCVTD